MNAAVLDFGDASVDVGVLPRTNDLRELRRKHRATHVLRADRDEFAVPIVVGAPQLSDKLQTVLRGNPDLVCHLWREALLRQMVVRGHPLVRGGPVRVLSKARRSARSRRRLGEQEYAP